MPYLRYHFPVSYVVHSLPHVIRIFLPWPSSVQFSRSVVSNSLQPHESQHPRPPCPSPTHLYVIPSIFTNITIYIQNNSLAFLNIVLKTMCSQIFYMSYFPSTFLKIKLQNMSPDSLKRIG